MTNAAPISLEQAVDAFEAAWETTSCVDVRDYVPPRDHPQYDAIVIELLRVDLEHRWSPTDEYALERYREQFSDLLSNADAMSQLAFEDYRLHAESGQPKSPDDYAFRYQIDVASWYGSGAEPLLPGTSKRPWAFQSASLRFLEQSNRGLAQALSEASESFPVVGDRWGDFELLEVLGTGAFATVFLARETRLANRLVALKLAAGCTGESDRLAHLQHSHIVPVHSVHQVGRLHGICMPYLGRTTLVDVLRGWRQRQHGIPKAGQEFVTTIRARKATVNALMQERFTKLRIGLASQRAVDFQGNFSTRYLDQLGGMSYVAATVWLTARIADGLAHAHSMGVLHRDIKPANILLSESGQPLILDFNVSTETTMQSSASAMVGGTLPYMSPEQLDSFESGVPIDERSDVYSLGVVLFELLTGKSPFPERRGELKAVLELMRSDRATIPTVRDLNPDVSPGLESIVLKSLQSDRSLRYKSALELSEDLNRHHRHEPLRYAKEHSWSERISKWCSRHPRIASATTVTAAAMVLLTIAAVTLAWRTEELRSAQSLDQCHKFQHEFTHLRFTFQSRDPVAISSGITAASSMLQSMGLFDSERWWLTGPARVLSDNERIRLRGQVAELLYWGAKAQFEAAQNSSSDERDEWLDRAQYWNQLAVHSSPRVSAALERQHHDGLALLRSDVPPPVVLTSLPAPDDSDAISNIDWFDHIERTMLVGETDVAMHLMESMSNRGLLDAFTWFRLGIVYLRAGKSADAEISFSSALALAPKESITWLYRGAARFERGELIAAKQDFDKVLAMEPQFIEAYINRALVQQRLGDIAAAEADLSRAIEMGTTDSRAFFNRASLRQQLADTEGSRSDYARAMAIPPQDETSYLIRGVHRMANDPEGALGDFRAAAVCNPKSFAALTNSAHVLSERLGNLDAALLEMNRLVEWYGTRPIWRASRAVLRARKGDRAGAVSDAVEAVQQLETTAPDADSAQTWYQVACTWSLLSRSQPDDVGRANAALARALASSANLALSAPHDPDLKPLEDDMQFKTLIQAAMSIQQSSQTATELSGPPAGVISIK